MDIVEFGDALLRTGDLDPVYVAVHKAKLDAPTVARLCLAYWCFYSLGTAAKLAEEKNPKKYWAKMMEAAVNEGFRGDGSKPWPRGAERRHFRGQQAILAMGELINRYKTPEQAVDEFVGVGPTSRRNLTYASVARSVKSHRGFGDWIAFKIADMSERVLGYNVDFSDCHLGIYKDPRQGAAVACLQAFYPGSLKNDGINLFADKPWEYPITDVELRNTVDHYVALWRKKQAKALPDRARLVNVQEIETIFCKYKSHLKGHYPVGKDTEEIGHGLLEWEPECDLARQLQQGLNDTRDAVVAWRKKNSAQLSLKGV